MLEQITRTDNDTRVQYALMILFGLLCIFAAVVPEGTLSEQARVPLITLFFGLTAGLWLGHLVVVLNRAASNVKSI